MSEIQLRPYQKDFIDAVRAEFVQQHKRVVGVAPCGAGKTIMTGWMIRQSLRKGKRSIFFVHRDELIAQTARTFLKLGIEFGIVAAGQKFKPYMPVQIASVQTLVRRLEQLPTPDFIICDECHHILANSYKKILQAWPKAFLLGVTATPQRTGGINLGDIFESMVESLSVNELINLGNLTHFRYFAPNIGVDLSSVREKFGEFVTDDIEEIMADKRIIGGIVENYQKLAGGKQAICYCVNVKHSKSVAAAFNHAGIPARHCDGKTPKKLRAHIVDEFRRGNVKILCNAELFGEGFDVPKCQAVILARPTMSLTLYIQQAMRAMRPDPDEPNKVAIIIDHVQNNLRHGLPNAEHDWSLDPNKKSDKRKCPKCHEWVKPEILPDKKSKCPNCGFIFPKLSSSYEPETSEPDTTEHEGQLFEIDIHQDTKKPADEPRIKRAPTSPEDFLAIANRKKYKIGWVAIQALEHAFSYKDCLHIAEICGYKQSWARHAWNKRKDEIFFVKRIEKCPSGMLE